MKINGIFVFVVPLIFLLLESSSGSGGAVGGIDNYSGSENIAEIQSIGRFAVQEYNSKENADLEFKRIIKAKEQVVSGKLYYLTLEAADDDGKKKMYEAKVWVKPWLNFKKLEEFKQLTPDDHAKQGQIR